MKPAHFAIPLLGTIVALLVSGCGGGGASAQLPGVAPTSPANAPSGYGTLSLSIAVPAVAASAKKRAPKYVSASTYQAAIVVTPQSLPALPVQIFVCTVPASGVGKVCSGTLSAPAGADSVAITLEDQPQSAQTRGNVLSQGSLVALVNAGATNSISAVLDGVVHNVAVAFAAPQVKYAPTLPYSAAAQGIQTVATYAAVNAYDADGNVITANGGYVDANGNNVAIGLSANTLCGGSASCSVVLGATSVAGPGTLVPVTATLSDSASQYSEALTITPSITFGNPGGTLTAGTVSFVRPNSCSAYLPTFYPGNASTLTYTASDNPNTGQTLNYSIAGFGTPSGAQSLDPRIAVDLYLTEYRATSSFFGAPFLAGTNVVDIVRIQNSVISQVPVTTISNGQVFYGNDQPAVSLVNSMATVAWTSNVGTNATLTYPFWFSGNGNLCNDQVPVPITFPPTTGYF